MLADDPQEAIGELDVTAQDCSLQKVATTLEDVGVLGVRTAHLHLYLAVHLVILVLQQQFDDLEMIIETSVTECGETTNDPAACVTPFELPHIVATAETDEFHVTFDHSIKVAVQFR